MPKKVVSKIEAICRSFLWNADPLVGKKALVAWSHVCKAKNEGGLGIRDMHKWNTITIFKHYWCLSVDKEKLWIKWLHKYHFKGGLFPCSLKGRISFG